VQTTQSELRIAQAARTLVYLDGAPITPERAVIQEPGYVAHEFTVDVRAGSEVRLEKVVALFTSRDTAISECGLESRKWLARAGGFDDLLETHSVAWKHLWNRFDIEIETAGRNGDNRALLILHLHQFHLLQTASMHTMDLDAGVPARGWHGEAYRGHIFWDELFVFPLLNLHVPQITRSLLMHRYWRLTEARENARAAGYRGAMYPWQSGSDGREESQKIHLNPSSGRWIPDDSHRQRHVNAAIAYNIWQYDQVTADTEFMSMYGAELFLEIARFWASVATYNQELSRYEILGVMGPDEYHDGYPGADGGGLNNNSYTNVMAVWVLSRALELLNSLPSDRCVEIWEALALSEDEIGRWRDITRKMRIVFHDDGIISQFERYDQLEEFDWDLYRNKYGSIARLDRILEAEGDTPNRYKASKQADVLMLFYLFSAEELAQLFGQLGYEFDRHTIPKNIDYYLKRTSHGSTLSGVVHSWVLARSDRVRSWQLFMNALESDISDVQGGTTAEGIHLGAMAGTVDLVQRGHSGLVTRGDILWFNPCLPEEWANLRMRLRYREQTLEVEIGRAKLTVRSILGPDKTIRVAYKDWIRELGRGATVEFVLPDSGCGEA
jgi:alpha,alpha-trehalase